MFTQFITISVILDVWGEGVIFPIFQPEGVSPPYFTVSLVVSSMSRFFFFIYKRYSCTWMHVDNNLSGNTIFLLTWIRSKVSTGTWSLRAAGRNFLLRRRGLCSLENLSDSTSLGTNTLKTQFIYLIERNGYSSPPPLKNVIINFLIKIRFVRVSVRHKRFYGRNGKLTGLRQSLNIVDDITQKIHGRRKERSL